MMADPNYYYPVQRKAAPNLHPNDRASPPYSHSRTRTSSSSVFPHSSHAPKIAYSPSPLQTNHAHPLSRRTPSANTLSTTGSTPASPVYRSASSRSNPPATSYVALLRKQKATVWCDRAQHEDPRHLAAQRAAKARAHQEVLGGIDSARIVSGGGSIAQSGLVGSNRVTAKIRHHGKAGLVGYAPENFSVGVGGVPMRLSATEVEGGDSDEEDNRRGSIVNHRRTGSGRSSMASSRRGMLQGNSGGGSGGSDVRHSAGGTPSGGTPRNSAGDFDAHSARGGAYAGSLASGSSAERGDAVAELEAPRAASNTLMRGVTRERSLRNPEELRRRGSVDERTMTLSSQRLFVANPDEDSD